MNVIQKSLPHPSADWHEFRARLGREVMQHPVITTNKFTNWFSQGDISLAQARAFMVQFSVFSNEFLCAQLRKTINAESIEEMRASKEILANEIGVVYRSQGKDTFDDTHYGATEGSIDGSRFYFRAAHFELLVRMAEHLELGFSDLGKRRLGLASTLFFCDELLRLYGSDDYTMAAAASFAVEHWAAAGFWDELIAGWRIFRDKANLPAMPLVFFTWHAQVEKNHAHHTEEELAGLYASHEIDEDLFMQVAREMLDGIECFWNGLEEQRLALA